MSHSSSPNRNLIFGWVKNLKKGNLLSNDSINEISDFSDDLNGNIDDDVHHHQNLNGLNDSLNGSFTSNQYNNGHHHHDNHNGHGGNEFLRPLLNHKSRSTNNVHRVRSNSQSDTDKDKNIRQNRDSFMMNNPLIEKNSKYFGVALEDAIDQASAKISIFNDNTDQVLKYGRIPIVVAKCGVYLKTNGLTVEGIFRIGGSSKRLKELQVIFNNPPDFGKKLNWDGYTVHDAASILRRYLNSLPEPLIPLDLYEIFREPLRSKPRIISYMKYKANHPKGTLQSSHTQPAASQPTAPQSTQSPPMPPQSNDSPSNQPATTTTTTTTTATTSSQDLPQPIIPSTPINNNNSEPISPSPLPSPTLSPYDKHDDCQYKEEKDNDADDEDIEEVQKLKKLKKSKNYKKLTNDVHLAIDEYKIMVDKLPTLSKQLLFYILDLLAMVQNHSQENLMSSRNLAAIFQPSILSHPNHDLDPNEYALSSFVVEFLIQYAYKLLPQPGTSNNATAASSSSSTNIPPKINTQYPTKQPSNSNDNIIAPSTDHTGTTLGDKDDTKKRQHSKSLSHHANHDLVGFSMSRKPVVDNDYFESDIESPIDKHQEYKPELSSPLENEINDLHIQVPELQEPIGKLETKLDNLETKEKPNIVISPSS